jgi:molecular chaperone GrpE
MSEEIKNQDSTLETGDTVDPSLDAALDPIALYRSVQQATSERDDFKDRLLRKQAEFENFKKRTDRERAEFVKYASAELMREVLNVVDSLELALNDAGSGDGDDQKVRQGFDLIYKQLVDSLKRFGLETIEAKGHLFDPNVHEAVSTEISTDAPEGTVVAELRRGYLLQGKLLRPAMVTVAAAPVGESDERSEG